MHLTPRQKTDTNDRATGVKAAAAKDLDRLSGDLALFLTRLLLDFPWSLVVSDWTGRRYDLGQGYEHWWKDAKGDGALYIDVRTPQVARDILGLRDNGMPVLEAFVTGDLDLRGNMFLLSWIRKYAESRKRGSFDLGLVPTLLQVMKNRFQTPERSKVNVKSHYDQPPEFVMAYLDPERLSYSCGMFEHPERLSVPELLANGLGEEDGDTLGKAQRRKFIDAATHMRPTAGKRYLDVGCGYGGQLIEGALLCPDATWYGVTHSTNQVAEAQRRFDETGVSRSVRIKECDYREATSSAKGFGIDKFDGIMSTGMACHVGRNGLRPYVKWVADHLVEGGRYLHHVMMCPYTGKPLESFLGAAFNMKYVWPGFYWFTYGEHMAALEQNGFRIERSVNLSQHYAKTTAAWYVRMMANRERSVELVGEQTVRTWEVYLAGASTNFLTRWGLSEDLAVDSIASNIEIHRVYCRKA